MSITRPVRRVFAPAEPPSRLVKVGIFADAETYKTVKLLATQTDQPIYQIIHDAITMYLAYLHDEERG